MKNGAVIITTITSFLAGRRYVMHEVLVDALSSCPTNCAYLCLLLLRSLPTTTQSTETRKRGITVCRKRGSIESRHRGAHVAPSA